MTSRRDERMTGGEGFAGGRIGSTTRSLLLLDTRPNRGGGDGAVIPTDDDAAATATATATPSTTTPRRRNNGRLSRSGGAGGHRRTGSEVLRDFERRSYGADVVPDPPSISDWREGDVDSSPNGATAEPPGAAAGDERRRLFAGISSSSDVNAGGDGGGRKDVLLHLSDGSTAADHIFHHHHDGASSSSVAQRRQQLTSPPPADPIHLLSTPRAVSGGSGRRWPDAANNEGAKTGSRRSMGSGIPSRTGDDFSLEWSLDDGDGDDNDSDWGDDDDEDGIDRYHQFMRSQGEAVGGRQRSQRTIASLPDEDDDDDEYVTAYRLRLRRMLDAEGEEDEDDDDDGAGRNGKRRAARRETARRRTRLLALSVLAIAFTAISMALRRHTDGILPEPVELGDEGDGGPVVLPDRHDVDPAEEERLLLDLLGRHTSTEVLRNSTSPQRRSMRWLLRSSDGGGDASAVIDPFLRAYVRDGPIGARKIAFEGSLLTRAVVERYALVTLYYSTNGDGGGEDVDGDGGTTPQSGPVVVDDAEGGASSLRTKGVGGTDVGAEGGVDVVGGSGWKDTSGWLSPYHHCEWTGVVCSLNKGYRKEVTELRLSGNRLSGGPLPAELGALEHLERLHLGGGNNITGSLPSEGLFGGLLRLREVRLEGNGLTGPLPIDLGGGWSSLEEDGDDGGRNGGALEVLDFTNNRISGPLPPSLGKLGRLSALRLSNNRIGGDIGDVLSVLGGLDALEVLLLDGNDVGGSIPESIGRLSSLRRLRLSNNALVDSVPRSVGGLGNLLELDLSHNRLDSTLPVGGDEGGGLTGLDGLTSLETLVLSGNAFHGRILESLFADDGRHRPRGLSELRRLRLDGNAFSGTIAPWIFSGDNLVALEELYVNDNSFSGEVPAELGSLATLRELALEGNDMVGAVPESLCRLRLRLLSADCVDEDDGGDDGSTMTCTCCTECVG